MRESPFITVFLLFLVLTGCGQSKVESRSYDLMLQGILEEKLPFLSVDSLSRMPKESYILLDARSRAEYEVSRIPRAVWVGESFDPEKLPEFSSDKAVVVYCAVGKRSEDHGAELARRADSLRVLNLYGGIFEWVNQGKGLEDGKGSATERIHAYDEKWGSWLERGEKVYEPEPD